MKIVAIIVCVVVGLGCLASSVWAGEKEIWTRNFTINIGDGNHIDVLKFVDPDNGNVCYLTGPYFRGYGGAGVGISCLKP